MSIPELSSLVHSPATLLLKAGKYGGPRDYHLDWVDLPRRGRKMIMYALKESTPRRSYVKVWYAPARIIVLIKMKT